MQLEKMSTAELIALVKRQEQELASEQQRIESLAQELAAAKSKMVAVPLVDHVEVMVHAGAPTVRDSLAEMVDLMDKGEEPGAGSEWHTQAKAALAVQQPAPVGYMNAAFIKERSSEFDQNGTVIFSHPAGECTTAVYLTAPVAAPVANSNSPEFDGIKTQPDRGRDAALVKVEALAWKWHREAVKNGFACSEPAQELFEVLGWPADPIKPPANVAQVGELSDAQIHAICVTSEHAGHEEGIRVAKWYRAGVTRQQ